MKDSRIYILIKNLTKKEKRLFKTYLATPFFNKRKDLQQLLDILEKGKHFSKAAVFKKIYPKTPFSDAKIRFCMSLLFRQVEQFLLVTNFLADENEIYRKKQLAKIFAQKDLSKHTESALKDAQTALEKQSLRNALFFNWQKDLIDISIQKSEKQTSETQLNHFSEALDTQFVIQKLKEACTKISLQSVYGIDVKIHFLDACFQHIQQQDLLKLPAIAIYFHCYHFLNTPEKTTHFEQFNQLLLNNSSIFTENELTDLVIASINFCVRQYNSGNRAFLKRHLELYQFGFDNKLFIVNGELARYTYQNAVTFGIILKAYDWVKEIIENYKEYLPKQYKTSSYSFNLARLHYEQNDKNQALTLLQKADSRDVLLSLSAKMLQLQIYFELNEYDLLHAHISATKIFIRRKKIMGYHREIYSNSLKFAQKILDLNPYSRADRKQLKEQILATKVLAEREWLLRQLD